MLKKNHFLSVAAHLLWNRTALVTFALASFTQTTLANGCGFGAGGATPPTWSGIDEAAYYALGDAWARHTDDTFENAGTVYREFGGWIYENSSGEYGYTTPIRGQEASTRLGNTVTQRPDGSYELSDTGERVVGVYHIHPENVRGRNGERWNNSRFSREDRDFSERYGVPSYMRHAGGYQQYDPAVNSPSDPPSAWGTLQRPPPRSSGGCSVAAVRGEPHLTTHDGRHVSFQGAGEFLALRDTSDNLAIMVRLEPYQNYNTISVLTALAIQTPATRIGIYREEPNVRVNGEEMLESAQELTDGTRIERTVNTVRIQTAHGDSIVVDNLNHRWLNAALRLKADRVGRPRGLLGNYDGDRSDDLMSRTGQQVQFATADADEFRQQLYETWGNSWRITQDESLFDYDEGRTTEDYQLRDFPAQINQRRLVEAVPDRKDAELACAKAGIKEPMLLRDCVYDILVTSKSEFAISYASFESELAALSTSPGRGSLTPDELSTGRILGGFANAEATLHVLGDAGILTDGPLVLTSAASKQTGAIFMRERMRMSGGFTASFKFIIDLAGSVMDDNGAKGGNSFAYLLSMAIPSHFEGAGAGLAEGIAIEFDTFANDEDDSAMRVSVNRIAPSVSVPPTSLAQAALPALEEGAEHQVKIDWRRGHLAIYVDDMKTPVLDAALELTDALNVSRGAYVGLSAATSDPNQQHRPTFWSHWSYPSP